MADTAHDLSTVTLLPVPDTRPGGVFWRTLRDNLPGALSWGLGYGVLIAVATVLYPLLNESNTVFTVLNGLGLMNFLSAGRDVDILTSYPGYLALQVMNFGPLILAVYVIPQALRAVNHEERQGTLDILLSTPISRWRLVTEKVLAIVASIGIILLLAWLSMMISPVLLIDTSLDATHATASVWHLLPISLVVFMATLMLSVAMRDGRHAGPVAATLLMISYFVRIMSDMTPNPVLDAIKPFSIFSYYRSVAAIGEGFQWSYDAVLLIAVAVLLGLALAAFQRRDLGV